MAFTRPTIACTKALTQGLIWLFCFMAQTAFGQSPKYIFYWGKMQCELLDTSGYRASIEVPANVFRESVFAMPYLWNGKVVCDTIQLRLEDYDITSIKSQKEQYLDYQAVIDQKIARDAKAGQVFHIRNLTTGGAFTGGVEIKILPGKTADKSYRRFPAGDQPIVVNKEWLDYFNWGPFITENMQRDYFTVEEVINTIKTEPVFLWNQYKVPDGMEVQIGPVVSGVDFPTSVANVENIDYEKFAGQFLASYGHLIQPGISMEFGLRTINQRHMEMRARMVVVEDNDPRLKLRRSRDSHHLIFQWGDIIYHANSLYLKQLTNNNGEKISCDPEINFFLASMSVPPLPGQSVVVFPPQPGNHLPQMFVSLPSFTVGEISLDNLAFDILYKEQTWHISAGELLPESLKTALNESAKNGDVSAHLFMKNISGSDYFDLSPLTFEIFVTLPTPDK